ncbi:MAG TPA: efflux RND transporter periplasmic adaptor subunit [Pyrinomonadaceae bacterium]|nr:efflux RND transporter periplasmic adaptor subunit [Pyrinomonadaceae bacterium]
MKRLLNTMVLIIVAGLIILLFTVWLRPKPSRVDVAKARRGPMRITVDGEGKTRVRDRYIVAAPVAGRLRRITLRRGDSVQRDQVIAQIDPLPLAPLDPRQRAEATARVDAAEDVKREADAMVARTKADYEQALRDLERCETLARSADISRQELELAQTAVATSMRDYDAAKSKSATAGHEIEVARAAFLSLDQNRRALPAAVKVHAPVPGRVLHVVEESERVISAGAPLVELSNPALLEVVIELLSSDAVKVAPAALVLIEEWGGPEALEAQVRLVEPSAFTKVSALGIEEQRVNVVADLTETSTALGDGYRVEGRIIIWQAADVLQVPVSALFRRGTGWSLFVVENGEAHLREVGVGQRTPFDAEIKSGLEEGAEVITHPSNQITEGARVEPQPN